MSGLEKFDLASRDELCEKNIQLPTHHENFHSVQTLSQDPLPEELQQKINKDMADLIVNMSKFLIRIAVVKDKEITYGSGLIEQIVKISQDIFRLDVCTAYHVLKDLTEQTVVYIWLYFDSVESDEIEIKDIHSIESDEVNDICTFQCTLGLLSVKSENVNVKHFRRLRSTDLDTHKKQLNRYKMERDKNKTVALLSHPHGCCKYISIGECLENDANGRHNDPIRYNLASCPGSSGGTVMRFGSTDLFVHSGWDTFKGVGRISSLRRRM